jgi:thiol-disulfide isomerase/thioredoxin
MMNFIKKYGVSLFLLTMLLTIGWQLTQKSSAPNVTFTTINGKKISMDSLKGKVVLINFWASDCAICVKEMPDLVNIYNAYKAKGFVVIAVAMPYDPPAQVLNYTLLKALPFVVMHDGFGEISKAFGDVAYTPTSFVYDKKGLRIFKKSGELNFTDLKQILDFELAK